MRIVVIEMRLRPAMKAQKQMGHCNELPWSATSRAD
jgi:hypothetical protein